MSIDIRTLDLIAFATREHAKFVQGFCGCRREAASEGYEMCDSCATVALRFHERLEKKAGQLRVS